jgi:hypothetical protein
MASGTTLRTSTNPAARAASLTGGTPGPVGTVVSTGWTSTVALIGRDDRPGEAIPATSQAPEIVTSATATTRNKTRSIRGTSTFLPLFGTDHISHTSHYETAHAILRNGIAADINLVGCLPEAAQ